MPFKENRWRPNNPKQATFLSIPTTIKEAFLGGGAGSGKSELLLMYAIVNGWHDKEGFKQLFMRRTHPEMKREIIPRTRMIYPRLGAKLNRSDMCWTFPREDQFGSGFEPAGGMIFFGHCENEDDVHNYDGMEINLYTPDELTSLTEYIYTYIGFTRVRTSNPDLPAIIRATGMPGDIGHTFVKKRFVDPYPAGGKILVGRGGNKRVYIHSTYLDNVDGDPTYGTSLEALPSEAERRAKKYGDWSTYEGSVFDEFRERQYPEEPDNAVHVVDKFDIPSHWPRVVAIDWGFAAMCSIGWAAIAPNKKVYIYRHQHFTKVKIEVWAPLVRHYIDIDKPNDVVICHSANQHRGDPHTILEQVESALGVSVRLGESDRVSGKLLIHEYLRWKPRDTIPGENQVFDNDLAQWIMRNKGIDDYKLYLESFKPVDNENIPRLMFQRDDDIKLIWEALKACTYAKSNNDGKKKEDVAEFNGDDPYDMLRMIMHAVDLWFGESTTAQRKLDKTQEVIMRLEQTGDMTSYYRNMRKLESDNTDFKPVMLFKNPRRRLSRATRMH